MTPSASNRVRSPRAPKHSVNEAIAYAKRIYDGVHRSAVDSATMFQLMGFAGKSGSSSTALGSLRQYGLIEGVGDRTRITDLALQILEPAFELEKTQAIALAVHKPDVFQAIFDRFDGRLPAADEPIRAFLIRDLGFARTSAEECIESLRRSVSQIEETPISRQESSPELDNRTPTRTPVEERVPDSEHQDVEVLRFKLTKDCAAEVRLVGNITAKAIASLLRHIELSQEVWEE